MSINNFYNVLVSEYAKKHFLKDFVRKNKGIWDKTYRFLEIMLGDPNLYLTSSKINKIHICDTGYIAKCEFKVVGSNESAKTSGNRIIVFVNEIKKESHILLIYSKTHINGNNETTWWEQEIKTNHKEIYNLFCF